MAFLTFERGLISGFSMAFLQMIAFENLAFRQANSRLTLWLLFPWSFSSFLYFSISQGLMSDNFCPEKEETGIGRCLSHPCSTMSLSIICWLDSFSRIIL